MRPRWLRLAAVLAFGTAAPAAAQSTPKTGAEVLQRMHDAYAGKWYKTLTFVQKTSYPDARVETWYEAAEIPGKLRIDVAPLDSMKTILFRADSIYQYDQGNWNEWHLMMNNGTSGWLSDAQDEYAVSFAAPGRKLPKECRVGQDYSWDNASYKVSTITKAH